MLAGRAGRVHPPRVRSGVDGGSNKHKNPSTNTLGGRIQDRLQKVGGIYKIERRSFPYSF